MHPTVIYCLVSQSQKVCYIGKTKYPKNRLHVHNTHYKRFQKGTFHYLTSYEVVKEPDCEFLILRHVPTCESSNHAERNMIEYMRQQDVYTVVNKK